MEVEIVFTIEYYEKTDTGYTAYGTLTVTDLDTGESISVRAYSGGRGSDPVDGVSLPIPLGKYEVLEPTRIGYRLEADDYDKGNDKIDGTDPEQANLRLHGPGSGLSYGCISVSTKEEWNEVKRIIESTKTGSSKVDYLRGLLKIDITKYGNLTVCLSPALKALNANEHTKGFMIYQHPSVRVVK